MNKFIIAYLRYFPIEIGKNRIASLVNLNYTDDFIYTNPAGIKFKLNIKEYVMRQIFLFGIYEKKYVAYLSSFPANNIRTIIDIGANIGNYTLSLRQAYPQAFIHAFEPNSYNNSRLQENIGINNFNNIKVNKLGLSNKTDTVKLFFDDKNMGASTLSESQNKQEEIIHLNTLDNYCDENTISNIDLIKIDIEGAELNCLKGAEKILLKTTRCVLQMEIDYSHCNRSGYIAEELFKKPLEFGFKAYLLTRWGKLKAISVLPENYIGNVIYLKGY
jgi:FkbM family methyltransferase